MKELDDITGAIVDAALKIHIQLGPGLLESVYEVVRARVLERDGVEVARQKTIGFEFDGINFGATTLKEGLHRIVNNLPASASPRLRVNQSGGSSTT